MEGGENVLPAYKQNDVLLPPIKTNFPSGNQLIESWSQTLPNSDKGLSSPNLGVLSFDSSAEIKSMYDLSDFFREFSQLIVQDTWVLQYPHNTLVCFEPAEQSRVIRCSAFQI